MKKDISTKRGPYNINHIDEHQKQHYIAKLKSRDYLAGAIERLARKMSDEIVRKPER